MKLSQTDVSQIETIYHRVRLYQKYAKGGFLAGGSIFMLIGFSVNFSRDLFNPHAPRLLVAIAACFFGLALGIGITASIFIRKQMKQEEELVKMFENNFPEQCPWKKEEITMEKAEEIRLKAKVDNYIKKMA